MENRGYFVFALKTCSLTVLKHFVKEFFTVSGKFLVYKSFRDRKGEHHIFPPKSVCLTVLKHFAEGPFCVSEKNMELEKSTQERGHHDLAVITFVSHYGYIS